MGLHEPVKQSVPFFLRFFRELAGQAVDHASGYGELSAGDLREKVPGLVDGDVAVIVEEEGQRLYRAIVIYVICGPFRKRGVDILPCLPVEEEIGTVLPDNKL